MKKIVINWLKVFKIVREVIEFVQTVATFSEGLADMPREERIDKVTDVAADFADDRIKLPAIFEAIDGPVLKIGLRPIVATILDNIFEEKIEVPA
jgi:hypothetical protein